MKQYNLKLYNLGSTVGIFMIDLKYNKNRLPLYFCDQLAVTVRKFMYGFVV